jgi:hypothetical protein
LRFSGQDLIDLFYETDRPDSGKAIVGVQLAIPPELNGTSRWIAEAVTDFARVKLQRVGAPELDTYAYRLASNAVFRDNAKIEPLDILLWRSLYDISNADGIDDAEEFRGGCVMAGCPKSLSAPSDQLHFAPPKVAARARFLA